MWAGKLSEPVKVYDFTYTVNEFGEKEETLSYSYAFNTRANVVYTGGYRNVINNEIQTPYTKTFILRSYVPVHDTSWIEWNNQYWRVTGIEFSKERQEQTVTTSLVNE